MSHSNIIKKKTIGFRIKSGSESGLSRWSLSQKRHKWNMSRFATHRLVIRCSIVSVLFARPFNKKKRNNRYCRKMKNTLVKSHH